MPVEYVGAARVPVPFDRPPHRIDPVAELGLAASGVEILTRGEQARDEKRRLDEIAAIIPGAEADSPPGGAVEPVRKGAVEPVGVGEEGDDREQPVERRATR